MPQIRPILFAWFCSSLLLSAGCEPQDSTADLRQAFEELKVATQRVDDLLASIQDAERAAAVVEAIKEGRKAQRDASMKILLMSKNPSRSAIPLLNEIDTYRKAREARFPNELRRLNAIPGVEPIVTRAMSENDDLPALFPQPGS